ncbi:pyrimidine 5'-nucleotidase [Marinomonas sp. 5E14-1]|uniref:pyrimidine 5'-nucleotidase n=1 Tax=Marinomonas sp. 5E14-1 TaxID=3153922 RepID=UPI003266B06E
MTYQWVLFDADETLFHFDNFSGLQAMFLKYDITFTQADFESYQSINKPLWVKYQNQEITADELQTQRFESWSQKLGINANTLNNEFLDSMAEICQPLTGALELVQYLDSQNIKMGIITNGFAKLQHIRLERTNFKPYFSLLIVSELVGVAKPHKDIFQYTHEQMGSPEKSHVLMVGDTLESDILGGNDFGFDTCWLNAHNKKHDETIQPNLEVSSLSDLLTHFKNL